jgi:hypothetical protein
VTDGPLVASPLDQEILGSNPSSPASYPINTWQRLSRCCEPVRA